MHCDKVKDNLKKTYFGQVRTNWFPWVNNDGSIWQSVGHTL